jgi:hypothetical protein
MNLLVLKTCVIQQWRTRIIFFWGGGGVQQIQLRIEARENGDLGAVAPYSGVPLNLQMNETCTLIRLLRMYIPWNWEFGSAMAKLRYATVIQFIFLFLMNVFY